MKQLSVLSAALVSSMILVGCAGTGGTKSPAASSKDTKSLSVADIVARYEKVTNGKEGRKKHPAMTLKGTLAIAQYGIEGPFTRYAMAPDSNATAFEIMGMKLNSGCHKGTCWSQQPGGAITVLTGDAATLQLQQSDYSQWEHLDRYYTSLQVVEPADGKPSANYRIKAIKKNGDTDMYDFSKESGYLVAAVIEGTTAQGRMQVPITYANYKDFDGMKMPSEQTQTTAQATIKVTVNEVSYAPLTDANFAQPK